MVGLFVLCMAAGLAHAAPASPGSELFDALREKEQGNSYIRVKMETGEETLQLQIKSRVTASGADVIYQVLFPRERKGEGVLLRRAGGKLSGFHYTPTKGAVPLNPSEFDRPLLGTALSYADAIDSSSFWASQSVVGKETIDRIETQIVDSKPPGSASPYSAVRTWVDPDRLVPLRIHKMLKSGGIRKIEVTRIMKQGDESLPMDLQVSSPAGPATTVSGSSVKRDVTYTDADFTTEAMKSLSTPKSGE